MDGFSQNLCFTKKIRYESRKQLAQARPRVKGQFVRMSSGGVEAAEAGVEPVARVVTVASVELAPGGPSPGETAPLTQLMPETRTSADGEEVRLHDFHASSLPQAPASVHIRPKAYEVVKSVTCPCCRLSFDNVRVAMVKPINVMEDQIEALLVGQNSAWTSIG